MNRKITNRPLLITLGFLNLIALASCLPGKVEGTRTGIMIGEVEGISYIVVGQNFDEKLVEGAYGGQEGVQPIKFEVGLETWSGLGKRK